MSGDLPKIRWNLDRIDLGTNNSTQRLYAYGYERQSLITSEGHPWKMRHKRPFKGRDLGGPFFTETRKATASPAGYLRTWHTLFGEYQNARFIPAGSALSAPPKLPLLPKFGDESAELRPLGSTGYARARPGNPTANAGQFLGELRDLPSIPLRALRKLRRFRALGDEYLNIQFGWVPFVRDLQDMYKTYQNLDGLLKQLAKDNGKLVRRRRVIKNSTVITPEVQTWEGTSGYLAVYPEPPTGPSNYVYKSTLTTTRVVQEKVWFVGQFSYYIPDVGTSQWTRRATAALFGLNPTPALLWELLPWSWLIDWFSNAGDIMSNISGNAAENLTSSYAYVMRTRSTKTFRDAYLYMPEIRTGSNRSTGCSFSVQSVEEHTTKSRVGATPYGFGVSWDGLSPYQLSILGALGISRSRF